MLSVRSSDLCDADFPKKPQLLVVVDTEEEFNWSSGFSRQNISVSAIRSLERVQILFEEYRILPVYVVDYPVAFQPEGYRPLQEIYKSGQCVIGAHLHPWVNPPYEEQISEFNSFPGNLPAYLEAEKLRILGELIEERFGSSPTIYKAGRYGIGVNTATILRRQGYAIDLSVCPSMNYSSAGGPDFTNCRPVPYWFGGEKDLLEIPLSVGFVGRLQSWPRLHDLASGFPFNHLHLAGVLARSGLLNKVWLSPEGYTLAENIALLRTLYRNGLRIFSFAFHSPSLEPANTPYVKSQIDLGRFLSQCRSFFDYFMGEMGGVPTTPIDVWVQVTETKTVTLKEDQ
jgi:hypothetical protein